MCKWFNKHKKMSNYEIKDNGDIEVKTSDYCSEIIKLPSIMSRSEEEIVFEEYIESYSHKYNFCYNFTAPAYREAIDKKENLITFKTRILKTYKYNDVWEHWSCDAKEVFKPEIVSIKTPLELFNEIYKTKYKLIESEEEFGEYLSSVLDCDTWCRKKLYNKMKELGLGDGFINQFADLVGNDLDKYYAMIDLANEVSDKDTLMYLYTYKFGK